MRGLFFFFFFFFTEFPRFLEQQQSMFTRYSDIALLLVLTRGTEQSLLCFLLENFIILEEEAIIKK